MLPSWLLVAAMAMASALSSVSAQQTFSQQSPDAVPGGFQVVQTDSQASAMMLALIDENNVMIIDKAENNKAQLNNGQPVWGTVMSLDDFSVRALEMTTNPFCASGAQLGNGTWIVAGGNHAIGYGGGLLNGVAPANGPYKDYDGGQAIRIMNPQDTAANLNWIDEPNGMNSTRWYPGIEVMTDGSVLLIGGATGGGYINRNYPNADPAYQGGGANPTWEFFPAKGNKPTPMNFMVQTSGLNMYPHTYLMPSGKLFMQANYSTTLWDPYANDESNAYHALDDMPDEIIRVYPASGATAMLPLTPANNYTPTILFCGGSIATDVQWGDYAGPRVNMYQLPAQSDCSSITPENADGSFNSGSYTHEENLPEPRTMGQFVHLPTGQMVVVNGASYGTAGYTNATWNSVSGVNQEGCAQSPTYQPVLYDPSKPMGSRLSRDGFGTSKIARLYHSSAILLPDGSVLIGGSNPHQDVSVNMPLGMNPQAFNTTYEMEKWYPPYYFEPRPVPTGLPDYILYGGNSWTFSMDAAFMGKSANYKANNTKVMVIRPGFSTHAMNMGQRSLQLEHSYTVNNDGSVNYQVQPMPTNQNIFVQGPALLFITIDGVPSKGKYIQVGLNSIGTTSVPNVIESLAAPGPLPASVNNAAFNAVPASAEKSSTSLGAIIGGAAGGAVVLIALIALIFCCVRRKRRSNDYAVPDGNRRRGTKPEGEIYGVSGYHSVALGERQRLGSQADSTMGGMYAASHYSMNESMMSKPSTPFEQPNAAAMYASPLAHDGDRMHGGRVSQAPSYSSHLPPPSAYGGNTPGSPHMNAAVPGSPFAQPHRPSSPHVAMAYQPYSSGDHWQSPEPAYQH